jgi:hypothetical protein
MHKLFIKKKKKKRIGKNGQVSDILKKWVLRCPLQKKGDE